jgi:hypothetical protein
MEFRGTSRTCTARPAPIFGHTAHISRELDKKCNWLSRYQRTETIDLE